MQWKWLRPLEMEGSFRLDATQADMGRRQGQQKVARDVMQQMLQWDAAFFLHRSIPSTEDVLRIRCRWKVSNCRHFLDTCITLPTNGSLIASPFHPMQCLVYLVTPPRAFRKSPPEELAPLSQSLPGRVCGWASAPGGSIRTCRPWLPALARSSSKQASLEQSRSRA